MYSHATAASYFVFVFSFLSSPLFLSTFPHAAAARRHTSRLNYSSLARQPRNGHRNGRRASLARPLYHTRTAARRNLCVSPMATAARPLTHSHALSLFSLLQAMTVLESSPPRCAFRPASCYYSRGHGRPTATGRQGKRGGQAERRRKERAATLFPLLGWALLLLQFGSGILITNRRT